MNIKLLDYHQDQKIVRIKDFCSIQLNLVENRTLREVEIRSTILVKILKYLFFIFLNRVLRCNKSENDQIIFICDC